MTTLFKKPDEDLLIAGIAANGLYGSRDGGHSWQKMGTAGSGMISHRPTSMAWDPQTKTQFWESGIYGGGGGAFRTSDDGNSFVQLGSAHHNDLISVDFTDAKRLTVMVGGHEQAQTLQRSTDGGQNWTNVGLNLPSGEVCTFPHIIDGQTHLVGCGEDGSTGIYRTTDGGMHWMNVSKTGGFGQPLIASDQSIYWVNNGGGLVRSVDEGQQWADLSIPGNPNPIPLIELPDKRLASIGYIDNMQTVILSADFGNTWMSASAPVPYQDVRGVVYSPERKAFYIWHFTCGNGSVPVPPDAVMSFDFDYTKN
jgi:photosystem II stability/assembly factor-like uncharacterized protein